MFVTITINYCILISKDYPFITLMYIFFVFYREIQATIHMNLSGYWKEQFISTFKSSKKNFETSLYIR